MVKNNETPISYKHLGKSSSSLLIKEIQIEMKTFHLSHQQSFITDTINVDVNQVLIQDRNINWQATMEWNQIMYFSRTSILNKAYKGQCDLAPIYLLISHHSLNPSTDIMVFSQFCCAKFSPISLTFPFPFPHPCFPLVLHMLVPLSFICLSTPCALAGYQLKCLFPQEAFHDQYLTA